MRGLLARFLLVSTEPVVCRLGVQPQDLSLFMNPKGKRGNGGTNKKPGMSADPLVDDGDASVLVQFQLLPRGLKPHHFRQQLPQFFLFLPDGICGHEHLVQLVSLHEAADLLHGTF